MTTRGARRGFVLLPVTLLLAVIAAVAWMASREGAAGAGRAVRAEEGQVARYVAEAALAHAAWDANASACTGYGLASTAFGAHSYQATFTPASGSPVAVSATATLASGESRTLSRSGVRVYEPPQTLALQPDPTAGKDTWVYEWKATWNYGLSPDVVVSSLFVNSWSNGLLEFDVSGVPAEATVISATLELRQKAPSSNGGTVAVHAVTSDWVEGVKAGAIGAPNWTERDAGVPWTAVGGDYDPSRAASVDLAVGAVGWFRWDVTSLVDGWVRGARPNRGLALVPAAPGTDVTFDSSDATTAANRPKLTVIYACECGVSPSGTTALQPGVADGKDAYVKSLGGGTRSHGGDSILRVRSDDRSLVQFDLSAIPAGATINSATLDLNAEVVSSGGQMNVHRVLESWVEGDYTGDVGVDAVTWNTRDGVTAWASPGVDYDATVASTASVSAAGVQSVDVTDLVASWASGTQPNHGLLLLGVGGFQTDFTSSEGATVANRPKLTVTYTCTCGVPCVPATYQAVSRPEASVDDAEERGDGSMYLDSSDLELVEDGADAQTVGIRFPGLAVPAGAEIVAATVEFTVDETGADPTTVTFAGEAADDAAAFGSVANDVTSRASTSDAVVWSAAPSWDTVGDTKLTPDLRTVIQEIVNRPGWASGNALALFASGGGRRTAVAWDLDPLRAPLLRVDYRGAAMAFPDAYVDRFESDTCDPAVDYANSDGTLGWSAQRWAETGDTGGDPCAGAVRLAPDGDDRSLRLAGSGNGVERAVNLAGATSAVLRLDYRRQALDDAADHVAVEMSGNGLGWTEVGRIEGPGTDAGYRRLHADVTAFAAADAALRLRSSGLGDAGAGEDLVFVDNLRIAADAAGGGCAGTLVDDFEAGGYAGNGGSVTWSAPWAEIGESDGAAGGNVTVGAFAGSQSLSVANASVGAWRGADLSAFTSATLEFSYRRASLDKAPEEVRVELSANGGASWTQIAFLGGPADDPDWLTLSFDVSAYLGTDTRIRMTSSGQMAGDDAVRFDVVSWCLD